LVEGGVGGRAVGKVTTKYCYRLFIPFLIKGDITLNMPCPRVDYKMIIIKVIKISFPTNPSLKLLG